MMRSIHPQNFITIVSTVLEICSGQNSSMKINKFKYENKQRVITLKLSNQELQFMCTALPLDEIYPPTKFNNPSWYSFGDMHWTKVKYENKTRAITKKKANKSYGSCALHSPLMRSILPQNFITLASIVLEICSGQNSNRKINKGQ